MARKKEYITEDVKDEQEKAVGTVNDASVVDTAVVEQDAFSITDMTDEEISEFVKERQEAKAAKAAIKEEQIPMHILMKTSAIIPQMTDNERTLQGRINHLQNRLNDIDKGRK